MTLGVIDIIASVIKIPLERLIPDKSARDKFNHEIEMEVMKAGLSQMKINEKEAEHASLFVAGWRPFVGWVCGFALCWHFILYDLVSWIIIVTIPDGPEPPALNGTETLLTVLLSMLGLGGLRTVEKIKGASREVLRSPQGERKIK